MVPTVLASFKLNTTMTSLARNLNSSMVAIIYWEVTKSCLVKFKSKLIGKNYAHTENLAKNLWLERS